LSMMNPVGNLIAQAIAMERRSATCIAIKAEAQSVRKERDRCFL
jgi:hypothetical protein